MAKDQRINSVVPEGSAVSVPPVAFVVLL